MKIISNNSRELKKYIKNEVTWIENRSVLAALNGKDAMNVISEKEVEQYNSLDDINIKGDFYIFDLLNEVKVLTKVRKNYFLKEDYYNYEKNIKEVYKKRKELKDPLNFSEKFLTEIYRIYINTISRNFYNKNIVLLSFKINEDVKQAENMQVVLSEKEKQVVLEINYYLKTLTKIIKKLLPDIRIHYVENEVYISDVENRTFEVEPKEIFLDFNLLKPKKFNGEKQFESFNSIRYCFEKSKIYNKDKLIIIFSSFSTDFPKYNYVTSLKTVDCNKLFILDDYGVKGSYYLGLDGDFDIESSIMSLITTIMAKYNIKFNDVIAAGSSKGGSAALYYGMKYSFGNIIAGAPQYRIGTYLTDLSIKDYGQQIFGDLSETSRLKYDNIIRLVARNKNNNIHILTSDGDNQYKKLLKDFEDFGEKFNLNLDIEKCDIQNHGEISKVFPEYMNRKIAMSLEKGCINNSFISKMKKIIKNNKK